MIIMSYTQQNMRSHGIFWALHKGKLKQKVLCFNVHNIVYFNCGFFPLDFEFR